MPDLYHPHYDVARAAYQYHSHAPHSTTHELELHVALGDAALVLHQQETHPELACETLCEKLGCTCLPTPLPEPGGLGLVVGLVAVALFSRFHKRVLRSSAGEVLVRCKARSVKVCGWVGRRRAAPKAGPHRPDHWRCPKCRRRVEVVT